MHLSLCLSESTFIQVTLQQDEHAWTSFLLVQVRQGDALCMERAAEQFSRIQVMPFCLHAPHSDMPLKHIPYLQQTGMAVNVVAMQHTFERKLSRVLPATVHEPQMKDSLAAPRYG